MKWYDEESCTFPVGWQASGVHCGIKKSTAADLALVVSDRPAVVGGVFTTNTVRAACIEWNEALLRYSPADIRGIVINSGNANAVTGTVGVRDNKFMATETARLLECRPDQILVGSTGVIGVPLPMLNVANGIRSAHSALDCTGGMAAAKAILTTDTTLKHVAMQGASGCRIGAMAKGAGMIHPNMATMICVLTTDAVISADVLQKITSEVAAKTFNCISIDGDTSTNDMFVVLANGASGIEPELQQFAEELRLVALTLAKKIVRDAEGASRIVEIRVLNARTESEAQTVARTISTSLLFKTALFGADPNWGRVLAAAGRAGVTLEMSKLSLSFAGINVLENGEALSFDEAAAHEQLKRPEVVLELDLGLGECAGFAWTSDLTHEYITINSSYRT
jgi:glutamate N-acetyltransferase/amino-acid N-acetyltransferase